jgi:hypothetical protein
MAVNKQGKKYIGLFSDKIQLCIMGYYKPLHLVVPLCELEVLLDLLELLPRSPHVTLVTLPTFLFSP